MVAAVFIRKRGTRGNELVIQDKKSKLHEEPDVQRLHSDER